MSQEELLESLAKLKAEIAAIAGTDNSKQQRMTSLVDDAISQIDCPDETKKTKEDDQTLSEKITEMVGEFETEHPQITELVSRITNRLSDLGI